MCSEFVTPQKNVLLATQPNLNDKTIRQVHKIKSKIKIVEKKKTKTLCSQSQLSLMKVYKTIRCKMITKAAGVGGDPQLSIKGGSLQNEYSS